MLSSDSRVVRLRERKVMVVVAEMVMAALSRCESTQPTHRRVSRCFWAPPQRAFFWQQRVHFPGNCVTVLARLSLHSRIDFAGQRNNRPRRRGRGVWNAQQQQQGGARGWLVGRLSSKSWPKRCRIGKCWVWLSTKARKSNTQTTLCSTALRLGVAGQGRGGRERDRLS